MNSATDELSRWVANLSFDDIPPRVRDVAQRAILDTEAVIVAGSDWPAVRIARTVHQTSSAGDLAFIDGTAAHVLDFDDTCFAGIIHGSAVIWPAVKRTAADQGKSGRETIAAFIIGSEVAYTIGAAFGSNLYDSGWTPSLIFGPIGAAAGTARILGLNAAEISQAIGLAAISGVGMRAAMGTMAKPLAVGRAARLGVESAVLVAHGADGPTDVLTGAYGLFEQFGRNFSVDTAALSTIGNVWRLIDPGLVIKRFPLCSSSQAATEAVLDMMSEHKVSGADIEAIHVDVMPMVSQTLRHDQPKTPAQAMFSIPFAVTAPTVCGAIGAQELSPERINDPKIVSLMGRTTYATDNTIADAHEYPEAARVSLTLSSGNTIAKTVYAGRGDPRMPLAETEFLEKVFGCCEPTIGADRTKDLVRAVSELHKATSLTDLIRATSQI